jgi:hypothetical protein
MPTLFTSFFTSSGGLWVVQPQTRARKMRAEAMENTKGLFMMLGLVLDGTDLSGYHVGISNANLR